MALTKVHRLGFDLDLGQGPIVTEAYREERERVLSPHGRHTEVKAAMDFADHPCRRQTVID